MGRKHREKLMSFQGKRYRFTEQGSMSYEDDWDFLIRKAGDEVNFSWHPTLDEDKVETKLSITNLQSGETQQKCFVCFCLLFVCLFIDLFLRLYTFAYVQLFRDRWDRREQPSRTTRWKSTPWLKRQFSSSSVLRFLWPPMVYPTASAINHREVHTMF